MKFRKKPVIIEAVQFNGTSIEAKKLNLTFDSGRWTIKTLEGFLFVSNGDWIITGVKGERYPCKPDIFEMTYEPMEA